MNDSCPTGKIYTYKFRGGFPTVKFITSNRNSKEMEQDPFYSLVTDLTETAQINSLNSKDKFETFAVNFIKAFEEISGKSNVVDDLSQEELVKCFDLYIDLCGLIGVNLVDFFFVKIVGIFLYAKNKILNTPSYLPYHAYFSLNDCLEYLEKRNLLNSENHEDIEYLIEKYRTAFQHLVDSLFVNGLTIKTSDEKVLELIVTRRLLFEA